MINDEYHNNNIMYSRNMNVSEIRCWSCLNSSYYFLNQNNSHSQECNEHLENETEFRMAPNLERIRKFISRRYATD